MRVIVNLSLLAIISTVQSRFSLPNSCREFSGIFKSAAVASMLAIIPAEFVSPCVTFAAEEIIVPTTVSIEKPKVALNEYIRSVSTGIEFYDYKIGEGPPAKFGDKVAYNYKGRLAGM